MLDILHVVFSSFWVWLGSVIMLTIVATAAVAGVEGVLKLAFLMVGRNS